MSAKATDFLYRYMSLGDTTRTEYVRQIVQDSKLYFASLGRVNDPLDCKPSISLKGGTDRQKVEFLKRGVKRQHPSWPSYQVEQEGIDILKSGSASQLDAEISTQWPWFIEDEAFICCLSSKGNDLTLFGSDYGDHHKGVCLEFRTNDIDFAALRPITYTNTRLVHYWFVDSSHDRMEKFFFTKLKSWNGNNWENESEWRFVHTTEGGQSFPPQVLTKIIFGKDTDPNAKDQVLSWIEKRPHRLDVYQSKLGVGGGSLDLELLKSVP